MSNWYLSEWERVELADAASCRRDGEIMRALDKAIQERDERLRSKQ